MELDRKYEKFRGGPTIAKTDRVYSTINKRGMIFLNANLHRMVGKPGAVYLYFNREKDHIVLEPTSPRLPEAFPVRECQGGYKVYAAPFCRHFGIKLDATHSFVCPDIFGNGKIVLDLSNTVIVSVPGSRKKKS